MTGPKDAEAELGSFRRVAAEIMADEHDTSENIVDALIRASAAARAEGVRSEAEFEVLQTELAAANAEKATRLQRECEMRADDNIKLCKEIDALQAEIERLRATPRLTPDRGREYTRMREQLASKSAFVANAVSACNFAGLERAELSTKLTNLRAAAERALAEWEAPYPEPEESDAALRAAIEASR